MGRFNLIEDFACFGQFRKCADVQGGWNNVYRRGWCRWEDRPVSTGPTTCMTPNYNSEANLFENLLLNADAIDSAQRHQPEALSGQDGNPDDGNVNTKVIGSIAYMRCTDLWWNGGFAMIRRTTFEFRQNLAWIEPGCEPALLWRPWTLQSAEVNSPPISLIAADLVSVGEGTNVLDDDWQYTNFRHSAVSLSAALGGASLWDELPMLCKRVVNTVVTSDNLWPWPLDQRIKDALIAAGRAPIGSADGTVTTLMEELFGAIPAGCGGGG
jgi:hypothetical protein